MEQIADVPVLEFQEGMAEQTVDVTVPAIKEELVHAMQHLPQDCIQGRLAEQILDFVRSTAIKLEEASVPGAHPRAHRKTELPKKRGRRKRQQKSKRACGPEEGLLEAAIARARREKDEFLQAAPQDETIKERQAEVYFRRNPEMLEFFMRKECLL